MIHVNDAVALHATGERGRASARARVNGSERVSAEPDADERDYGRQDDPLKPMELADHCESAQPVYAACQWKQLQRRQDDLIDWRSWEANCCC